MAEAPRPFDIDDAHSLATPTAEHPGVTCIDSAGRGVEVDLTAGEVRRRWASTAAGAISLSGGCAGGFT